MFARKSGRLMSTLQISILLVWFHDITLEESRVFLETLEYHLGIVEETQLSAAKL